MYMYIYLLMYLVIHISHETDFISQTEKHLRAEQ